MYKVGLTGGIGTGKSYVGKLFSVYGVEIIDSDIIARVVVLPGSPTLKAIAEHFGQQVIAQDGSLDRRALRELVFTDKARLNALNAIIHPAIHRLITEYCTLVEQQQPLPEDYHKCRALQQGSEEEHNDKTELINTPLDSSVVFSREHPAPYVILDIPLLFENNWDKVVDRILVIDCAPEIQLERVMNRDHCSKELAQQIIARQCPRAFKLEHGDDVICTDSPHVIDKREAVLNLHLKYLALASHH